MWIIGCRLDNRTITIGLASDISDFPRLSVTAKFAKILPKITMHLSADCPIKRIRSISSDRWTLLRISEMIKTRDQRWRLFIYRSSMDHKLCRYWNSDETLGLFDSTRLEISYRLINNASPPELKIILRQRANTNKSNVIKRIVYKSNQSTRFNAIRIFGYSPVFWIWRGKRRCAHEYTRITLHTWSILGSGFQGRRNGAITITSHSEIHSLVG